VGTRGGGKKLGQRNEGKKKNMQKTLPSSKEYPQTYQMTKLKQVRGVPDRRNGGKKRNLEKPETTGVVTEGFVIYFLNCRPGKCPLKAEGGKGRR